MVKRLFAVVFTLLIYTSCSFFGDKINEGWKAFESGQYESAKSDFSDAINSGGNPEAYVGYGWSCAMTGDEDKALSSFEYVLNSDSLDYPDALSGAVFAGNAMKIDTTAAKRGAFLLNLYPNYVFVHDTTITWKQVAFTTACSFANCGDFSSALNMIKKIAPGFNADYTTESGVDSILSKLNEISQWI